MRSNQKIINNKLKNMGNTLVRLNPINDWTTDGTTANTLFVRGKHYDAGSNTDVLNSIPVNFTYNAGNPNSGFTTWQSNKNDPYLRTVTWGVLAGLAVLFVGLWWVQVVSHKHYAENQKAQSFRTVRIPAVRGKILDHYGVAYRYAVRVLIDPHPAHSVRGLLLRNRGRRS